MILTSATNRDHHRAICAALQFADTIVTVETTAGKAQFDLPLSGV